MGEELEKRDDKMVEVVRKVMREVLHEIRERDARKLNFFFHRVGETEMRR
jgi:hypothetical protein